MSCFIVERSMKGFTSGTIHGKLGIRAGNTGYFSLQDVRVPKENRVGEEGEGFKIAMFALEQGRYTVAAGATGVIRASRDASVAYALRARNVRDEDRQPPTRQTKNCGDGSRLPDVASALVAAGYLKNTGQAERPRDESGEMAGDRSQRESRFDGD